VIVNSTDHPSHCTVSGCCLDAGLVQQPSRSLAETDDQRSVGCIRLFRRCQFHNTSIIPASCSITASFSRCISIRYSSATVTRSDCRSVPAVRAPSGVSSP